MCSAGIAGAPLRMPVPGRVPGPLGRMAPPPAFGPYPGFPADRQTKPDPYVTPMPDHREPPVLPGGGIGVKPDSLVNVTKSGGEKTSLEDFDKLRSAAGVAESAVTHPDPGMLKFTTPDGTEVMWRSKSTRQGKTVEIHIHNPASRTVENGPGRAAGDKLPTMKLRYGE